MKLSSLTFLSIWITSLFGPKIHAGIGVQWYTPFTSGSQIEPKGITLEANAEGWISSSTGLIHITPSGAIDSSQTIAGGSHISSNGNGTLFIGANASLNRYSSAGGFLSSTPFTGLDRFNISGIASNAGGIFTAGQTTTNNQANAFLAKHSLNGTLEWQTVFGTNNSDSGTGIALDLSGNSYLCGFTFGTLPGAANFGWSDAFVAKFDTTGSLRWQTQSGSADSDYAYAITADAAGNTYVAGKVIPVIGGIGYPDHNAFLTKLNSSGTKLWTRTFGRNGYDEARTVEIDIDGNIWIGGTSELPGITITDPYIANPFVALYSPGGALLDSYLFDTAGGGTIYDMAANPFGGVDVVGFAAGLYSVPTKGTVDPFVARVVPEPGSWTLVAIAICGFAMQRNRPRILRPESRV